MQPQRKLLVIDTAYTYEAVTKRGMHDAVTSLELDGFFSKVWTVHPVATLTTTQEWTPRYGPPVHYRVNDRHMFIEGKMERFRLPSALLPLNFLISQLALLIYLFRLIRREQVSVLRAGDPLYSGLLTWALARLTGRPFLVRLGANHDKFFEVVGKPLMPRLFRRRSIEKKVERFVMRRADLIAAANEDYLNFAFSCGVRADRTTIFPYGNLLDRSHFQDPASRDLPVSTLQEIGVERGKFIMYVGRLIPAKRPQDVVEVLAELRGRGHDLKAVLVGHGEMGPALFELAAARGVASQVILAGSRPQQWLAEMIPQAASVVSPVTGRALSEAALGAAPIAAYDTDWQGEIIRHGETGELVPFRAWNALANSVERFLNDPDYALRMGRAAREAALRMFDRTSLDQHERDQYLKIIEGRAG